MKLPNILAKKSGEQLVIRQVLSAIYKILLFLSFGFNTRPNFPKKRIGYIWLRCHQASLHRLLHQLPVHHHRQHQKSLLLTILPV